LALAVDNKIMEPAIWCTSMSVNVTREAKGGAEKGAMTLHLYIWSCKSEAKGRLQVVKYIEYDI